MAKEQIDREVIEKEKEKYKSDRQKWENALDMEVCDYD